MALMVGVAVLALQFKRASTDNVSFYDEGSHLSYVQYVASGHIPHIGDTLNTWGREVYSCHAVFPVGVVSSVPCGEIGAPGAYPEGGTFTSAGWPPLFYAYAAVFVRVLGVVGVDPLYAARVAACLLWAMGAAALVLVAVRFGANFGAAAAAGLVAGAIPFATLLGAYVTPYSAQLLLSVLLCGTVLNLMRDRVTWRSGDIAVAVVLPPLAIMVVPHALVAVLIAYLALGMQWASRLFRDARPPRRALIVLAGPVLALCAYKAWDAIVIARTTPFPASVNFSAVTHFADPRGSSLITPLFTQWWHFWPNSLVGDSLVYGNWENVVGIGAVMLAAAGVGAALLNERANPFARWLALGLIVGAPLGAWAFERTFAYPVPVRYGSSIIGVSLLVLALSVARLQGRILLTGTLLVWLSAFFNQWP